MEKYRGHSQTRVIWTGVFLLLIALFAFAAFKGKP